MRRGKWLLKRKKKEGQWVFSHYLQKWGLQRMRFETISWFKERRGAGPDHSRKKGRGGGEKNSAGLGALATAEEDLRGGLERCETQNRKKQRREYSG